MATSGAASQYYIQYRDRGNDGEQPPHRRLHHPQSHGRFPPPCGRSAGDAATGTRAPLADAGVVPLLARHLICDANNHDSGENASAALLNLSISAHEALMSSPVILDALAGALTLASSPASA